VCVAVYWLRQCSVWRQRSQSAALGGVWDMGFVIQVGVGLWVCCGCSVAAGWRMRLGRFGLAAAQSTASGTARAQRDKGRSLG
jgi:hypothetical protein